MPYPALTFANLLDQMTRQELEQFVSLLQGYLSAQHKEDGSHSALTADSVTTTGQVVSSGTGQNTFVGDVIARLGTGTESGIGKLATVNGTALLASEAVREGLLIGGVANGSFFEQRIAGSPFTSGYELKYWLLSWDTNTGALRFGNISGRPTLMDGGTGSTAFDLGTSTRPLNKVQAVQFFRSDYGSAQGEWDTFTPTWTALTVGNGTVIAKYSRIGKVILVDVVVIFGSTTTIAGSVFMSLPASDTAVVAAQTLGDVGMLDNSASAFYAGHAFVSTGTVAALFSNGTPLLRVAAAEPFVWAVNDQLHISLCYQEA